VAADHPHRPGRRHHTDEQLLEYLATTPEQKLRWLHAVWRFTADFMPAEARRARELMREHGGADGELGPPRNRKPTR
jgi:hypothetical protein